VLARFSEPASCAWSPNAKLIACASGNQRYVGLGRMFGNLSPSRIVICRVDNGATRVVTDSTSTNESPIWTLNGHRLLYVSSRMGPRDVYALEVTSDGSTSGSPVRLTTGLGAQSISISAEGHRLAYSAYAPTANLWSIPMPTHPPVTIAGATQITTGIQVIERSSVSRDGKWLYYPSDRSGNSDIYRLPLAGGEIERLTDDPSDDFSPSPSPDGKEIVFHSWRSGSRDIYVMPLDGGPLQQVTHTPLQEAQAEWSPDGSMLAYTMYTAPGGAIVVKRNRDKSWGAPVQRSDSGYWQSWSPDGKLLVSSTSLLGGSLFLTPVDSGPSRLLLDATRPGSLEGEQAYFSEDGRNVFFNSHDSLGNASIWTIPASGGTPRLLVRFNDPARPSYRPEWSMGAGRILFTIDDRQSDVWVMDIVR
jgi:Tol biopolymer transport system component